MTNTARLDAGTAAGAGADWLALAAAPTFAGMALWTALIGHEPMCGPGSSAFGGMTVMYLLMSAFHLAPWFRLIGAAAARRQT